MSDSLPEAPPRGQPEVPPVVSPAAVLRSPAGTAGAGEGDDVWARMHHYWQVVYGRRWMLLATTILGGAIAAFMTLRQPRLYTAQATIEFKTAAPPGKELDLGGGQLFLQPELVRRLLTTKILAARVINAQRARGEKWFELPPPGVESRSLLQTAATGLRRALSGAVSYARSLLRTESPRPRAAAAPEALPRLWEGVDLGTIDRYYAHISIRPVPNTSLYDIVVTHPDPVVAAMVANDHARAFIDMDVETKVNSLSDAQTVFGRQLAELRARVEASRKALTDYQLEHGILDLPKDATTLNRESLRQLNEMLTAASADRIRAEVAYRHAASMSPRQLALTLNDEGLQAIRDEILQLRARYQAQGQDYGQNHPDMVALRARIDSMEERLATAAQQVLNRLRSAYEAARTTEDSLRRKLEEVGREAGQQDREYVQLLVLQREVQSNEQLYTNLLEQSKEHEIRQGTIAWTNVKLVDRAVVPGVPSFPQTRRAVKMGLLLGLLAGLGLALFLERMDTTVHTPESLSGVLGIPTLGVIPDFRRVEAGRMYAYGYGYGNGRGATRSGSVGTEGRDLVTLAHPASVVTEAYRTIRTNMLFSSPGGPPRAILVTSAQPGEGKTVTAVNLAVTLALAGSRVLVVDGDMRKPGCDERLRVPREPGLSAVLSGQARAPEAIVRSPLSPESTGAANGHGLFVLPAGRIPPNPAELVSSAAMPELLASLREDFDFVLVDSPPVLPVTDSVAMATVVDGVLLVVREGEWSRDILCKGLAQLRAVRGRVLGAVLNAVHVGRGGSSSYYYRRYYGYGRGYGRAYGDAPSDSRAG